MFTITITKTTIEEKTGLGKLVKDDNNKHSYTSDIIKKKEIKLKIYEQVVEDVDIVNVIEAVNKPVSRLPTREEIEKQMQKLSEEQTMATETKDIGEKDNGDYDQNYKY